jgi:serine/threonine protein kinase
MTKENLWFVTELADEDLAAWLRRCQAEGQAGIPPKALLNYLTQAALALDCLRAHGMHHRGMKPSNLLRVGDQARVADFVPWPPPVMHHIIGRPVFVSPEEFKGQVSQNTDQYKLAIAYFHLRTGQWPFRGTAVMEQLLRQLQGEPSLNQLPAAEQSVVARALHREPRQRYGSCTEFIAELRTAAQCVRPATGLSRLDPAWLWWNDGCVRKMARTIEAEGSFEDLAILADALEEAGCSDQDLLCHCRQESKHIRTCFALQLCLGREVT